MKRIVQHFVAAVLAAVVMAGCASDPLSFSPDGKAFVRGVHGAATYATNGVFMLLKVNMQLPAGTTIKTGSDSDAYLQVNGVTSTIKVAEDSTVELTRMEHHGFGPDADTDTVLSLKSGTVLGSVRKLSANSIYTIHTPNGVAGIRGTDFKVAALTLPNGQVQVTYFSVTGTIVVSANVDGKNVTQVLNTGQQWVPGEVPVQVVPGDFGTGPMVDPSQPPPYLDIYRAPNVFPQQPFNGSGAPNPAVDVGQNPYNRVTPAPIHNLPVPQPILPPTPIHH